MAAGNDAATGEPPKVHGHLENQLSEHLVCELLRWNQNMRDANSGRVSSPEMSTKVPKVTQLLWVDGGRPSLWVLTHPASKGPVPRLGPEPTQLTSISLSSSRLHILQALAWLGCLPMTLGRDKSGFSNLNTLLPRLETPDC